MAYRCVTELFKTGERLMYAVPSPQNLQAPFPLDALPNIIKQAVIEAQRNTRAPMGLVASSAISAVAVACQNSIDVVRPNGLESPCSLFMLAIAESGERKSTVDSIFTRAINEFEKDHANV